MRQAYFDPIIASTEILFLGKQATVRREKPINTAAVKDDGVFQE
jgi:hypothetical protein